jgi:hypothetical protein
LLYRLSLKQHSYTSHPDFLASDHKPVSAHFSLAVFSPTIARDELLLPAYEPIVRFCPPMAAHTAEDLVVVYEVKAGDRRLLAAWDWIGLYRAAGANLENHVAFAWAPSSTVR